MKENGINKIYHKARKEDKYIVIKKDKLEDFFNDFTKGLFTTDEEEKHIDSISWKEVFDAVKTNNKYIVCNQDEPYADAVWDLILKGEESKI